MGAGFGFVKSYAVYADVLMPLYAPSVKHRIAGSNRACFFIAFLLHFYSPMVFTRKID